MIADERFADQFAQDAWPQTKLQITRDLFECIPDVILVFEQLRMGRMFEVKKIGGRKHFSASKMIKLARDMQVFWLAHASRVLIAVSRRNKLFLGSIAEYGRALTGKSAIARRARQHARRVRYPEPARGESF